MLIFSLNYPCVIFYGTRYTLNCPILWLRHLLPLFLTCLLLLLGIIFSEDPNFEFSSWGSYLAFTCGPSSIYTLSFPSNLVIMLVSSFSPSTSACPSKIRFPKFWFIDYSSYICLHCRPTALCKSYYYIPLLIA